MIVNVRGLILFIHQLFHCIFVLQESTSASGIQRQLPTILRLEAMVSRDRRFLPDFRTKHPVDMRELVDETFLHLIIQFFLIRAWEVQIRTLKSVRELADSRAV